MIQDSKVVTRIDLDVSLPDVQKGVSITQGDTNRRWIFSLTNGGEPLEVPARWTAVLTGTKPDGTLIYNGTIVENGQIVYDFSSGEQPGTVVGTYPLQLEIYNIGGELVFSPKMWVRVFPHMSATEAAQSTNEFTAMSQFVAGINDVIDRVEQAELAVKEADERAAGYLKDISSIKSDLKNKAQKSTTLAGYGITDAYTKSATDAKLANKASKATTLRGYGITDAYTKEEAAAFIGDMDAVLDELHAYAEALKGGDAS